MLQTKRRGCTTVFFSFGGADRQGIVRRVKKWELKWLTN